jgi:hypothetical protein
LTISNGAQVNRDAVTSDSGNGALWIAGICLMILESAVLAGGLGPWLMTLQTPLLLVIYVSLTRSFAPAAVMVAAWLPVADVLSGGPPGVIAFGLAGVFFGAQTAVSRLRLPWGFGHWLVSVGAGMLFAGLVTMSLLSMAAFTDIRTAVVGNAVVSVTSVALFAWPAGRVFEAFDTWWKGRGRSGASRTTSRLTL